MLPLQFLTATKQSGIFLQHYKKFLMSVSLARLTSAVGGRSGSEDTKNNKARQLRFNVNKFGELSVRDSASCNFIIAPICPQLNPDQNLAVVDLPRGVDLKVDCSENALSIRRLDRQNNVSECHQPTCNIKVPIKYNVDAHVAGWSDVKISDLQNERFLVSTERGNCLLSNLQSNGISVSTSGGSISSEGLLHGNAILKTQQNGSVTINKLLSQYLDVTTDCGSIDIKSLYAVQSKLETNSGNVHIGNAHRSIEVKIADRGKLTVDCLDGNLSASVNVGSIEVFVSRTDGFDIRVLSGDIALKLSTSLDAHLDLEGNSVAVDDEIELSNVSETLADNLVSISGDLVQDGRAKLPTIRASTKDGSVILQLQNWIDSLKLTKTEE